MNRSYNPAEIRAVAKKIGALSGDLSSAGSGISGLPAGGAFGNLPSSDGAASALKAFTDGLKKEFTAGSKLMTSTESSITAAAKDMETTEEDHERSFSPNRAV